MRVGRGAFLATLGATLAYPARAAESTLNVVATTTTIASLAQSVLAPRAHVRSLIPIGASPETYAPTPDDVAAIAAATLVLRNGVGLDAWLDRTIAASQNARVRVVTCTDGLPVRDGNPHLWMDPVYARAYARAIRDAAIAADPSGRALYTRSGARYDIALAALIARIRSQIATIPAGQRKMIVFHNAWAYYSARFGLQTVGVLELSPGQEPGPAELAALIDAAKRAGVRAAFAEPEFSPKLMQTLAQSAGIATIRTLYDDSIGTDPRVHDYISMLDYDTQTIVAALGGASVPGARTARNGS